MLSNLNSNLALTLGYLNPALNNSALDCKKTKWGVGLTYNDSTCLRPMWLGFKFIPAPTFLTCNPNLTRNQVDKEPLSGCATSKSSFIHYFIQNGCCVNYVSILTKIVPVSFCVTIIQF